MALTVLDGNGVEVLDGNGVARTVKTTLDGSDHVPHQKIDSVAGTVAATQSGSWNVALTGAILDGSGRVLTDMARNGDGVFVSSTLLTVKRAWANLAVGTDTAFVAAVATKKIRVLAVVLTAPGPATIVFNSKPAGAGVAVSATFNLVAGVPLVLPPEVCGWIETVAGEGLSATVATNAVSAHILYAEV